MRVHNWSLKHTNKLENVLPQGLTLLARSVHVHRSVQQIQVDRGRMLFVPLIVALTSANTSHRTRSVSIIITNGSGRRIVVQILNTKCHQNPSTRDRVIPGGRADMAKLQTAFRNLLNVPKYAVSDLEVRGSSLNNYGYLKRRVKMKHSSLQNCNQLLVAPQQNKLSWSGYVKGNTVPTLVKLRAH